MTNTAIAWIDWQRPPRKIYGLIWAYIKKTMVGFKVKFNTVYARNYALIYYYVDKMHAKEMEILRIAEEDDYLNVESRKRPSEWKRFGVLFKKQVIYSYRDWVSLIDPSIFLNVLYRFVMF